MASFPPMFDSNNEHSPEDIEEQIAEWFRKSNPAAKLQKALNADIFVISGTLSRYMADEVVSKILYTDNAQHPNVAVFLCTFGGDPDAAYIIARAFRRHYQYFSVYISGQCKSAGTLLTLGADEIVMSEFAELGPLDIQLQRADDLNVFASGLDIAGATHHFGDEGFSIFEKAFLAILQRSGGIITTKTAADIAVKIATGIVSPLVSQLDAVELVRSSRSMDIAIEYGIRLGARPETVYYLAARYPSHSFVIDYEEAQSLFQDVRLYDEMDTLAEAHIQYMIDTSLRFPSENPVVALINTGVADGESNDESKANGESEKG